MTSSRTKACLFFLLTCVPATASAGMLQPGDPFPSWSLLDQTGTAVTSSDVAGKTYLLWYYPKAMTPGCTVEGQGLRDRHQEFNQLQLTIFGVSFDEPAVNAEFVKQESFPFALLSDRDRKLAVAVGAAADPKQAVARRISYLVGPDGKVLKAYDAVEPAKHAEQVAADLKQLATR